MVKGLKFHTHAFCIQHTHQSERSQSPRSFNGQLASGMREREIKEFHYRAAMNRPCVYISFHDAYAYVDIQLTKYQWLLLTCLPVSFFPFLLALFSFDTFLFYLISIHLSVLLRQKSLPQKTHTHTNLAFLQGQDTHQPTQRLKSIDRCR
jgi:hypothetical protein